MSKIVLDTNCLVQCIPSRSKYRIIWVTSPYVIFCNPYFNFNLIQNDPDDNKFVDCAICANAKLIVTEDHHFDILKHCDFPRIPIMGLDEFKDLLQ